jgi:hypothetical protein
VLPEARPITITSTAFPPLKGTLKAYAKSRERLPRPRFGEGPVLGLETERGGD